MVNRTNLFEIIQNNYSKIPNTIVSKIPRLRRDLVKLLALIAVIASI